MHRSGLPQLRQWQIEARDKWIETGNRGVVEVVTGGGKTLFALASMSEWLSCQPDNSQVLIIVPTTALQDQWLLSLSLTLGVPRKHISIWPEDRDSSTQFHIMVINTARTRSSQLISRKTPWLLIADECHRYGSEKNSEGIVTQAVATLGLTATAEREFDNGLYQYIIPNLGPLIFRYPLKQALHDGVVSPFELINVETDMNLDETEKYAKLSRAIAQALSSGDEEKAQRLAMARSRVSKCAISRIPTTIALVESEPKKKTLIFHEDIESVDLIADLLRRRGTRARAYHSRISPEMRRDNLRMFYDGQIDVLVACRALDEGLDVPGAERAIISASTSSTRQRIQRIGRVLRRSSDKSLASVYTIFATDGEAERLESESRSLDEVAKVEWLKVARK